jgi:hypothetical protein
MKYRTRIQYTETDKALTWERWRQGESLNAIARLFDRNHSAIGASSREPAVYEPRRDLAPTWRWPWPNARRSRAA